MATVEDERTMQIDEDRDPAANLSDSNDSDDESSSDGEPSPKVEWLATGREKRSTAGNRMKSMIAAEEPDDELELLFAEDGEDAGFTDVDEDASDVQMDSSSDDEDAQEMGDDLEGEKELEKQARESRQAARKRKAQEAIPVKFRKKVKIDTSRTSSTSATPTTPRPPRPKKKSERLSWLPTVADLPTRASQRETTMAGKEQLHKQMAEREFKRLKQIEAMERKAKKMEALKKPPMTQAERLAEAALVEKRNAKSLNRWEEAEKQREEERKAKLAALNNRTLEGPVVTFWSGVGEWIDGKLKHVGKIVTIEEKPAKKKRASTIGHEATPGKPQEVEAKDAQPQGTLVPPPKDAMSTTHENPVSADGTLNASDQKPSTVFVDATHKIPDPTEDRGNVVSRIANLNPDPADSIQVNEISILSTSEKQASNPPEAVVSQPQMPKPTEIRPTDQKPQDHQPPSPNMYTTSTFAPLPQPPLMKPPDMKPASSCLAPPAGVSQSGLSMPVIGYHSTHGGSLSSSVLAPPNSAQTQSPLSISQTNIGIYPIPPPPTPPSTAAVITAAPNRLPHDSAPVSTVPPSPATQHTRPPIKPHLTSLKSKAHIPKQHSKEAALLTPPSPPPDGKATRNCIILQNFNENAVREKSVQTRILFDREMNKLPKQGPAPRCAITNLPARYRDPKTGLLYHNASAFKEIRKLCRGHYKWSTLIGAWVDPSAAARGVPARILDPNAPSLGADKTTTLNPSIKGDGVENPTEAVAHMDQQVTEENPQPHDGQRQEVHNLTRPNVELGGKHSTQSLAGADMARAEAIQAEPHTAQHPNFGSPTTIKAEASPQDADSPTMASEPQAVTKSAPMVEQPALTSLAEPTVVVGGVSGDPSRPLGNSV